MKSLAAVRGTCLAFLHLVDAAPADTMLVVLKAANILPPGIAEHLNSSRSWYDVVQRHAAVMRRLSSGACSGMSHLQLNAQHRVQNLAWSPDWPATTLAVHVEPCQGGSKAQFLVDLNTGQPTAAFPITEYLCWQEWISETQLMYQAGFPVVILDVSASPHGLPLRPHGGKLSSDKHSTVTWAMISEEVAVYQLPLQASSIRSGHLRP